MSEPAPTTCTGCGREVHWLEVFPRERCIDCHAADPAVQREIETMTSDKLARMWGGGGNA